MHTTSDVTEGLYPEEVSNVIQLHPPVAEAVQDLHPLSDEQVLVLPSTRSYHHFQIHAGELPGRTLCLTFDAIETPLLIFVTPTKQL